MHKRPGRFFFSILSLLVWIGLCTPGRIAWAQESEFEIFINQPAEGETFYSGPTSLLYSLPVSGWITSAETDLSQIEVRLEVLDEHGLVAAFAENLYRDGTFEFHATANPENSDIQFPAEIMVLGCGDDCHFSGDIDLPAGQITVRLTAIDSKGREAVAERHIKVDRSEYAVIPVHVVHEDDPGRPLAGVTVIGSTRLYLWRARNGTGVTDADGYAYLRVEALTFGSTRHTLRVEPAVINGVLYESSQTAEVMLPPGAQSAPPVTLTVSSREGQVHASLPKTLLPVFPLTPVWLIQPEDGSTRQESLSDDGKFHFQNLPLDTYLLAFDNERLIPVGLKSAYSKIDLTSSLTLTLELPVLAVDGSTIPGIVRDEDLNPLSFAWVTPQEYGAPQMVMPGRGEFILDNLPKKRVAVIASAPGFYSQAQVFEITSNKQADIFLKMRPDTQRIAWGKGEVVIPGESMVSMSEHSLTLERGWLWGWGGDTLPLVIQTAGVEISLNSGKFALEIIPGPANWLYIFEGSAVVTPAGSAEKKVVQAGEMINLANEGQLKPVELNSVVISALHDNHKAGVLDTWEPTLGAKIRDRLARIGVGTAQMVTFITYFIVFMSLVLVPLGVLYSFIRRNSRKSSAIK
jgi:hypothetical protein